MQIVDTFWFCVQTCFMCWIQSFVNPALCVYNIVATIADSGAVLGRLEKVHAYFWKVQVSSVVKA